MLRGAPLDTLGRYERQRRKVALDVVQQTTLRNRAILNTREPAARQAYYDDLRAHRGRSRRPQGLCDAHLDDPVAEGRDERRLTTRSS